MSMRLEPYADQVIVRPIVESTTTPGGIVLPDMAKEKPTRGEIVAVGPGCRAPDGTRVELDAKVGDVVIYSKYAGVELEVEKQALVILKAKDLLVAIREV